MKYMSVKMNEIYVCKYEWNMCVLIWMKYVCVFVMKYMCVNMNEIYVCKNEWNIYV